MARAALAALLLAAPAVAQPPAGPAQGQPAEALRWLAGQWQGTGTMFQRPSTARLEVRPALGGRFVELSYRAGPFEGRAFYRPAADGRWQATWFDNRGISFPIAATLSGQTLTAEWGSAEIERGRTVYALGPDGHLRITDSVRQADGAYRVFAEHTLSHTN